MRAGAISKGYRLSKSFRQKEIEYEDRLFNEYSKGLDEREEEMPQEKSKADVSMMIPKQKIESDKGSLVITITSDLQKKEMRMDFNVPISWIVFGKMDAVDFVNSFLGHIKRIQEGK
jgi:hypothetical protein